MIRTISLIALALLGCTKDNASAECPADPATAVGTSCSHEQLGCDGPQPIHCAGGVWAAGSATDAAELADGGIPADAASSPDAAMPLMPLSQGYHVRTMTVAGVSYGYQIYIPTGYTPATPWPVILFTHGSGEKGTDNMLQLTSGLGPYVTANQATFPAIVVFPQLPKSQEGSASLSFDTIRAIQVTALDQTLAEVNADLGRLYLTGLSAGAYRQWGVIYHQPTRFAAFMPIAGDLIGKELTNDPTTTDTQGRLLAASLLKAVPIHSFHGGSDTQSLPAGDRELAMDFAAAGATDYVYKEYGGYSHNVWDMTYADPATWTWLFAQHK